MSDNTHHKQDGTPRSGRRAEKSVAQTSMPVASAPQIGLRLAPDERTEFVRFAEADMRPLSAFAKWLVQRGLADLRRAEIKYGSAAQAVAALRAEKGEE